MEERKFLISTPVAEAPPVWEAEVGTQRGGGEVGPPSVLTHCRGLWGKQACEFVEPCQSACLWESSMEWARGRRERKRVVSVGWSLCR